MAVVVAPYQVNAFNALPSLSMAGAKFDANNGLQIVQDHLKTLFRKHGVENKYGVSLLHKHFHLEEGERMTDIRGTSNPLTFANVFPTVWCIAEDGQAIRPMEFSLEATNSCPLDNLDNQKFLQEFISEVKSYGLKDVLGICSYPGDEYPGRLEFTVGRSNVNLTPEEGKKLYPEGAKREAAWFFTDNYIKRGCKCQCANDAAHSHGGHYIVRN